MKQSQNYASLSKNAKQFKAVLGLDLEFFDYMNLYFKDQLDPFFVPLRLTEKRGRGNQRQCSETLELVANPDSYRDNYLHYQLIYYSCFQN